MGIQSPASELAYFVSLSRSRFCGGTIASLSTRPVADFGSLPPPFRPYTTRANLWTLLRPSLNEPSPYGPNMSVSRSGSIGGKAEKAGQRQTFRDGLMIYAALTHS